MKAARQRVRAFCERFAIEAPIILAPMPGACPPELSAAVASAGGMGACGALLMAPPAIADWAAGFRARSNGGFLMNTWVPDPEPRRDHAHESRLREFLGRHGPALAADSGDSRPIDFSLQCEAMLAAAPRAMSSIMGLYPPEIVSRMKARGIAWFATVTTVGEAREAVAAGADAVIAQGMEAGGHRGVFDAAMAERLAAGLMSLLPAVVDAVDVPVIGTGGIGDGRTIAAALVLGASAVQIGTGFLRTPEAAIHPAWADAIGRAQPEDTMLTRAFSGRLGRAIANHYVKAAAAEDAPAPAPYPVQRALTAAMREAATKTGDIGHMQAWTGQSGHLARAEPAGDLTRRLWQETMDCLAWEAIA